MGLFSFSKKRPEIFTEQEQEKIVKSIAEQEKRTSGEIRLYVEPHCAFIDPVDRARELFHDLKIDQTRERNGVLIYIAYVDHQLAIVGDEGIYQAMGNEFWHAEVKKILSHFSAHHFVEGVLEIISDIGTALIQKFPYNSDTDRNELSNDIVFGK
ncbi:MAG: TPM domain-containing protein [Sphingobacteriales bacterium]